MGRLSHAQQRGFTLVEVMVALAVIALTAAGAMTAIGNYADQKMILESRLESSSIAWNRLMTEYQRSRGWLPANARSVDTRGTEFAGDTNWHWELNSEPTMTGFLVRHQVDVRRQQPEVQESPDSTLVAYFGEGR